jgi:hypothetical protein
VSQSPFLGKITQATKVKMSRNYLCRLGSKMQARTHNDAPMASKSQIKDIQYKYYKYKNMMEKLQARVFAELSKNCEFDPAKQEVMLDKSFFQQMTDKLGVVSNKLSYYSQKLRNAGFNVSSFDHQNLLDQE